MRLLFSVICENPPNLRPILLFSFPKENTKSYPQINADLRRFKQEIKNIMRLPFLKICENPPNLRLILIFSFPKENTRSYPQINIQIYAD